VANAYSILHNYQQELYKPNLKLMNSALQFKQQSLNANRAKLQTMYDEFSFLDVAKEEDQEYLEGRLQATKTIMDKYSSLDLSSNNLTGQLVSNMSNVVDDNVRNAVISTKIYQSEQAAWAKLRDENPEKYSEVNHAYSRQGADAWLNDGGTGTVYNGGGGTIQYVDVGGKLAKEIPAIAKALKAEWVELAAGGGYFRDVVSKARVGRGQLEAAMDGLLNEQDKKQLQINAWGEYDGMSYEQLDAAYTNHFEPRITSVKNQIKSLEGVIAATSDPKLKEQRKGTLKFYQEQLGAYEANSFQNVEENYGKEAAYQSLYDNQFRGNYLDAYSYTDRITKIATYDNDVKTRNHEHKLEKLSFDREKHQDLQEFRAAKLRQEQTKIDQKAAGSSGDAKPGDPGYVPPLQSTEAVIKYENAVQKIEEHSNNNKRILKETKDLFGISTPSQTRDLANLFKEGFAGKETITFNGKEINVKENLGLLLEYQNNILTTSPGEKAAFKVFDASLKKSLGVMKKVAQGDSPDWESLAGTPRFNFIFEEDEEIPGKMKKKIVSGSDINYYSHLLEKENLTPAEEYTLDVYHRMHLLMDPEVDDVQKEILYTNLLNTQFSQLSDEDYNSFPNDIYAYKRMTKRGRGDSKNYVAQLDQVVYEAMEEDGFFTRHQVLTKPLPGVIPGILTYQGYEGVMEDISETYKKYVSSEGEQKEKYRQKITGLEQLLVRDTNLLENRTSNTGEDYYLSDITAKDSEFYDTDGNEVSLPSPNKILELGIKGFSDQLETDYKDQNLEPSLYPQVFSTNTSGYNNLATLVGLPAGSKIPITIQRVWDKETGKPTNEVEWYYTQIKTVKGVPVEQIISSKTIGDELRDTEQNFTTTQLSAANIINFDDGARTYYDASWGEDSNTLELGNGIHDDAVETSDITKYGNSLSLSYEGQIGILTDARRYGGTELFDEVQADLKAFEEGAYSFKMESINNIWQYSVYSNDGTRLHSIPTEEGGVSKYSTMEIENIYEYNKYGINDVMYSYLFDKKILKAQEEYEKNKIREQKDDLYNATANSR